MVEKLSAQERKVLLQLEANPYVSETARKSKRAMFWIEQLHERGLIEPDDDEDPMAYYLTEIGNDALRATLR